jgi:hypothetical protein
MKVTKAMIEKADEEHFKKEDTASLERLHALNVVYFQQKGKGKEALSYVTSENVRKLAKEIEKKKILKRKVRAKTKQAPIGSAEWVKQQTQI